MGGRYIGSLVGHMYRLAEEEQGQLNPPPQNGSAVSQ